MKGKISVAIKNRHIGFQFELERNITILTGDSGTGKTKLINMVRDYAAEGKNSGITLKCEKPCVTLEGNNWQLQLENIRGSVVFVEESTRFLSSYEFAKYIQGTDNYYVFVTREPLPQIPYSIDSIKRIEKNRRKPKIVKQYNHIGIKDISEKNYDVLIVEDSKSGFRFFSKVGENRMVNCVSANGKSNILSTLAEQQATRILVIADAAAFGSEIRDLVQYIQASDKTIDLFLPESFEWLILKSAIFNNRDNVRSILGNPIDYIECRDYFSWERFFTDLLVSESKDRPNLKYPKNKNDLPSGYLSEANMDSILKSMT